MLDFVRTCRCSTLGTVAFGLAMITGFGGQGCAPPPPPSTPESEPSGAAATAASDEPAAEPAATSPDSNAPGSSSPAPEPPASAPPDTRGRDEIQRIMLANRDDVRACYDAALAQNPGISGDLVIEFTIDPQGEVKQAEVNWAESELHVPELDACALDAVRKIKFPASSRGMESKVTYPFNFNPPRPASPAAKP